MRRPLRLPDGWTTDTVRANDITVRTYRTGAGPPLLLAHGFYESARCRRPVVDALAEQFTVHAYDARGHGHTDAPATGYQMADRVADMREGIAALGLDAPVVYGHSMGAATAAWLATEADLDALVLEDPARFADSEPPMSADERRRFVRDRVHEWRSQSLAERVDALEAEGEQARRRAVAQGECDPRTAALAHAGYPVTSDAFGDIDAPTLVLKADADDRIRQEERRLAGPLDGPLVHIDGAGHTVVRDEFDAAVSEVRAFVERRGLA
ncbi:alpha/beta fold hydrolase [Halosegnis longus]|uniref:alpha/beta fold hydrolase n=1 Tax=Halosegnis longus TaxID=2216012 RepID=UPI00096AC1FD|nr:alpha/beta hydrolase [Salella cibi]